MASYRFIATESLDDGRIVRVILNRPEVRNAQNRSLLIELNDALLSAEADDDVRLVILLGAGPMFSSGHDLGSAEHLKETKGGEGEHPSWQINGGTRLAAERRYLQEWQHYLEYTRRWRDLRKITVAQVHGKVFAGALMLAWCCDFIVAEESTEFADVVGTRLGMCGVEYFAHPWELGPRLTKELMLTGDSLTAEQALGIGMVSKLFPAADLDERTLAFARRLAAVPTVAALLVKESVNQTVDIMGFRNAINACFSLHQVNHAHWAELSGGKRIVGTPEYGVAEWRDAPPVRPRDPRLA